MVVSLTSFRVYILLRNRHACSLITSPHEALPTKADPTSLSWKVGGKVMGPHLFAILVGWMSGWWFQPIWKILVIMATKYLKPPPICTVWCIFTLWFTIKKTKTHNPINKMQGKKVGWPTIETVRDLQLSSLSRLPTFRGLLKWSWTTSW